MKETDPIAPAPVSSCQLPAHSIQALYLEEHEHSNPSPCQKLVWYCQISQPQQFGQVFSVVVCSLFPHDVQCALNLYATNTLLFGKFVRLKRDLAGPVRGTGLGLYISKQLVEAMGGSIWVESSGVAGQGSRFCFTLRAASPASLG